MIVQADPQEARRAASHWYIRLREEADDETVGAQFEDWLDADPLHAQAWGDMCETMAAVGRAPPELRKFKAPVSRRRAIFRKAGRATPLRRRSLPIAAVATAACCVALLAFPAASLRLRADHVTSTGGTEIVRLEDGSSVRLGPESALSIDFSATERKVRLLKGEALFDVVHNPARPFRVAASGVETTVLGTSFDVRLIGEVTAVSVRRGHVRVEARGKGAADRRDLLAGQWVRVTADRSVEAGTMAPELIGSWSAGEILADNRSIADIVEEIRPWHDGKIILTDASLGSRPVTGIYSMRDPAKALSMIVKPYGGTVRQVTPWLLIVSGS